MLGILSNSFQVATRQAHWADKDATPVSETKLQPHWREDRRARFARKSVLDQATDGARPKLFGW
ncbi:hypothetical protein [Shimia sp.]|jgi:hypothetical protein|uniref:hypothetical protein n=1 Tax=unclassified Shimia TaxID=2630038 RepID=UPI0025D62A00|nr:hypothetical protein [Shimia sp.]MCH2068901.1 hypothetical protein [Shimia sp.]